MFPESHKAHLAALAMAKALAMTALDVMHTPGALSAARTEMKEKILQERKVVFQPFQVKPQTDKVKFTAVPVDCNIGWSKHM